MMTQSEINRVHALAGDIDSSLTELSAALEGMREHSGYLGEAIELANQLNILMIKVVLRAHRVSEPSCGTSCMDALYEGEIEQARRPAG